MNEQKTIFKVIEIEYCADEQQYPEFDVYCSTIGFFSSLEKAEKKMNEQKHTNSCKPEYKYFGFLIEEYALDNPWTLPTESRRSYLPDGSLLAENLLSETPGDDFSNFEEFLGRPADKIRFKTGDLVEVLHHNSARLEIVGKEPPSPEWVRDLNQRGCKLDSSDDAYYTLDEHGNHSHPEVINVFPV